MIPMEAAGTYRVHLVSAETGFDNPFAPRYEIRPRVDAPPTASFLDPRPTRSPARCCCRRTIC